jgi:hypothetical protein
MSRQRSRSQAYRARRFLAKEARRARRAAKKPTPPVQS